MEEIIYTGTLRVRQIADETLEAMKQAMGLRGIWRNIERKARAYEGIVANLLTHPAGWGIIPPNRAVAHTASR